MSPASSLSGAGHIFKSIDAEDGLLSQHVVGQIRELIKSGKLAEGDRLPSERQLGEQLGVSRTVVREAIKLLRAAGLVRVRMGVGSFITLPSRNIFEDSLGRFSASKQKELQDLIEVRETIEPRIAALAAQNGTVQDIAKLERAVTEMERYVSDPYEYIVADNTFHNVLAEACHNNLFKLILYSIVDLLQENRRVSLSLPGAAERANTHHRRILEAVAAKDPQAASAAMIDHMRQIRGELKQAKTVIEDSSRQNNLNRL
jgi:GntR family transcriptional repressor for pyruvate dehydrogenase complex